jgi:outer membrane protein OmpA-like peptidoglycan-associated protein
VQNAVSARIHSLLLSPKTRVVSLLIVLIALLAGCASSNVSRKVASDIDMGEDNADKMGRRFSNGDMVESYQNASQLTRGAVVGGAAGAVVGAAATSTVGVIPGAAVGMVLGASYGSYIDSESTLADQLINRGAIIIVLGDQIMVVIPSARIFLGMTPKIKPQAYSTLNLLTRYINSYTKMLVRISAYTDDIGERGVNLALSKQQAHSVERYLIANDLDARLLVADGYGATSLVMQNCDAWGKSDNYRLEFTLEKLDI